MNRQFELPPVITNDDGNPRRVGFEVEFAGVTLERSATLVQAVTGGELKRDNPFRFVVDAGRRGEFRIETDASILQERAYEKYLKRIGVDIDELDIREPLERFIKEVAATVVPNEIVTPPLALENLDLVGNICTALESESALGTRASILYGFGVHMNPELPSREVASLLAHLQAFALLYDWIVEKSEIDPSRRVGPYIDPWPDKYVERILRPGYQPSRDELIRDYVTHIPSRNHALDMLPAFVFLAGDGMRDKLKEPNLVKPRPAFHYRLPNCRLGESDWHVADEWHYWVAVERLAADEKRLSDLAYRYARRRGSIIARLGSSWTDIVDAKLG